METINQLNTLISRNYDAEEGFKQAAEKAEHQSLKTYFTNRSQMHYDLGHEIKDEIKKLNGDIEKGTSVKGDLHRSWLNIKSAISGNTDEALIEECMRGQETAEEDYQEAIDHASGSIQSTLINHKHKIKESINELSRLEEVVA